MDNLKIFEHSTYGNSVLYNGDCVEIMDEMVSDGVKVDKVLTSPPYNIIRPNSTDRGYDLYKDGMSNEDYIKWIIDIFNLYDKLLNENGAVLFNMSYGTENPTIMIETINSIITKTNFTLGDMLVWKKRSATPNNVSHNKMTRIVEYIFVLCRIDEYASFTSNKKIVGKRDTGQYTYENVFNFFESKNNDYSNELNKATFSTSMVQNLIDRYIKDDDVVLDNFSGTGTTMYQCIANDIKCYGIELSLKQCEHTEKRLNNVQMNLI